MAVPVGGDVRDHPRSRGEYWCRSSRSSQSTGSSPLSRGIQTPPSPAGLFVRIIPALAGNTHTMADGCGFQQDHPRSRGEYVAVPGAFALQAGSSPLSRGIRPCEQSWPGSPGIIPALAGNTHSQMLVSGTVGDHPRSRGEYSRAPSPEFGTPWIIPALAGNT